MFRRAEDRKRVVEDIVCKGHGVVIFVMYCNLGKPEGHVMGK